MNFGLTEEQLLFKRMLRDFLEERCPTNRVRAVMESDTGHDPEFCGELARLGVQGLLVPQDLGGAGLEVLDLALAAEELGYAAAPGPFLAVAMATAALQDGGREERGWMSRIASGEALVTIAYGEEEARWEPADVETAVVGGRIRGVKTFVPAAAEADAIVVAARSDEGVGLWLVERDAPGISVTRSRGIDPTRRLDTVVFHDTPARELEGGARRLRRSLDVGLVCLAADAFGGAKRCLDMTLRYVMEREQFGQPIGAFQAVKHQLANLACELEPTLSLWWYAAHALDRLPDAAERHAALAKAHLTDVFDRVAREATELHGGIAFTWEFDLHLWFRRAIFDRSFLGEAAFHRARAADLAGW